MSQVGKIDILATLNTTALVQGAKKAVGVVGDMGKKLQALAGSLPGGQALASGLGSAGKGLGSLGAMAGGPALAGVLALGAGLTAVTVETFRWVDATQDAADGLGVTAAQLSLFNGVAVLSGTKAGAVEAALGKLNIQLGDTDAESGPAADALARLGLKFEDVAKLSPADQLKAIIGKFGELKDPATRASVAVGLFGKGGAALLPLLNQGEAGFDKLSAAVAETGAVLDQETASKIGDATQSIDELTLHLKGLALVFVADIAPAIESGVHSLIDWVKWSKDGVDTAGKFLNVVGQTFFGGQEAGTNAAMSLFEDKPKGGGGAGADASAAKAAADARAAQMAADLDGAVSKLNKDLQKEIDQFGMSAEQIKVWELAQKGASAETLKLAESLTKQKKALEAKAKADEAAKKDAAGIIADQQTPLMKLNADLEKAADLRKRGLLTEDQFQGAASKAKGEFDQSSKAIVGQTPVEAYSARLKELDDSLTKGSITLEQFNRGTKDADRSLDSARKELLGIAETPTSKLQAKFAEIDDAIASHFISAAEGANAKGLAQVGYQEELMKKAGGDSEPKFSGALAGDSVEARSQILKFTYGTSDPAAESLNVQKQLLQVQQQALAEQRAANRQKGPGKPDVVL